MEVAGKAYHKIQSPWKRNEKGKFLDEWTTETFGYLQNCLWVGQEKVDGTNIRLHWTGEKVIIGGRTDRAEIPPHLQDYLEDLIERTDWNTIFGRESHTIYGEGFGEKIQKGSAYGKVRFALFDVTLGGSTEVNTDRWNKKALAESLGVDYPKEFFTGTLHELKDIVEKGFQSHLGDRQAEGLVLRPAVAVRDPYGQRVITKLKTKDFR